MQRIEDLKEILKALQDIGNEWHAKNISLREENFRLLEENQTLRENYEQLREQNDELKREIKNLSENVQKLIDKLRDDIITEIAANNSGDFQGIVKSDLLAIRRKLNETPIKEAGLTSAEEPTSSEKKSKPRYSED